MKTCTKCKSIKHLSDFYKDNRASDGLYSSCKICNNNASRKWRSDNPYYKISKEKSDAYQKKYRNSERGKASYAAWLEATKELRRKKCAEYYKSNKQSHAMTHAAWRAAHPDAKRTLNQNRRAKKRASGGRLSSGLASKLFVLQKGKCACGCGEALGNNYHLDHIMPIALGGTNTDDNIQLLRASCNMQKSKKHPVDFMQEKGFLL